MTEAHPAVDRSIKDLRGERVALLGSFLFRNVLVHPESLVLQHGDVHLLKTDPVCLQEAYDLLLMLFYLRNNKKPPILNITNYLIIRDSVSDVFLQLIDL